MIEIEGVSKAYGEVAAVDNVSMTIEGGSITVIVGTSGSGKTTLLRMINRLVEPTTGHIRIDDVDNGVIAPHELRRRIGYVIQNHGLFPHRTVADNIATVPRLLGWPQHRIKARVEELLQLFQLDPSLFGSRFPHELSGGQSQRVGVARALAAEPKLLLMDEPFGALDPVIRASAQADLLAIQKKIGTSIVLVTHDMDEAFGLAGKIAVMNHGRLLQYATPTDILMNPANDFVGRITGGMERPFRLLALKRVKDISESGEAEGASISGDASQRDALAQLLWSGRSGMPVIGTDGAINGRVTVEGLLKSARTA